MLSISQLPRLGATASGLSPRSRLGSWSAAGCAAVQCVYRSPVLGFRAQRCGLHRSWAHNGRNTESDRWAFRDQSITPVWGGKSSRGCRSAMLWVCSNYSGSCSRRFWFRSGRARISCSRTYCCAINSPSSPVRLEHDRVLGFAAGTSCSGSWLAASVPAGVSI